MQDLGTLGGTQGGAAGINLGGQVVGWSYTVSNLAQHAFIYSDGAMSDLNSLIDPASGLTLNYASAINGNGWITGSGTDADGQTHAFLLTPVPEPSGLLALLTGAAGRCGFACKKRK